MKFKFKDYLPYIFSFVFIFYGCPLIIQNTGSAMFVLLIMIPFLLFCVSIYFGMTKKRVDIIFVLILMVCFTPSIFIYMNSSASIYILIYGVLGLVGNTIGYFVSKSKRG
ncbi:hypothetical protein [Anaerorhabdus sp.]|jgi:hypothetical protein|uniref:hypothetical protein n=1 Tax=Anaerorhabdus sp. TaxID=1872524 RepID=UPI002FC777ED